MKNYKSEFKLPVVQRFLAGKGATGAVRAIYPIDLDKEKVADMA